MSNEINNEDKKPNQSIDKKVIPKDEVSYFYGFKTIIKNDMVGKALVMSMPIKSKLKSS